MCWCTKNKIEERLADKDIETIKIVKDCFGKIQSFYHPNFLWNLNQEYKVLEFDKIEFEKYNFGFKLKGQGFHSYSNDIKLIEETDKISIYFNDQLKVMYIDPYVKLVKCIIPKGSRYYINEYGEYISNCLKICVG